MAGRKKLEKLKKTIKRADGKIVVNATKETRAKVKAVCDEYARNKRSVKDICREQQWKESAFYRAIGQYGDCKELANSVGLGLRNDAELRPAKVQAPKIKETITLSDLVESYGKTIWTEQEKCAAITTLLEKMAIGIPLGYAAHLAGIRLRILKEWCREVPGLIEQLEHADAQLIERMFGWLATAGDVASKQGKLGEVLRGLEQRLPERWAAVERVDLITRDERGNTSTLSLSAEQVKATDADFVIEETKK
jgi:hypothetical protein